MQQAEDMYFQWQQAGGFVVGRIQDPRAAAFAISFSMRSGTRSDGINDDKRAKFLRLIARLPGSCSSDSSLLKHTFRPDAKSSPWPWISHG